MKKIDLYRSKVKIMAEPTSNREGKKSKHVSMLYRHSTRKKWGLALLAWDHGEKRGYQFEDGKLRVFKKGFFELLDKIAVDTDEKKAILATLRRRLGWRENVTVKTVEPAENDSSFDLQVELFLNQYPKGFQDTEWAKERRGIDTTRCLKRHRDVAIVEARKLLSRARLHSLLEEGSHRAVIDAMRAVGDSTDLIAKAKLSPLEEMGDEEAKRLAEQLFELLHGEERLEIRFERFVDTLARSTKKQPTWQLATLFLALFDPKGQLCVKTSTIRAQAMRLGRRFTLSAMPNAPKYDQILSMIADVQRTLEEEGLAPRDLLDVYDFMETTLSRKAERELEALKIERDAARKPRPDPSRASGSASEPSPRSWAQ